MKKPDPVELALERLGNLRTEPNTAVVAAELRKALKDRSNLVVAKAATIAGELRITDVIADLAAAFDRLMANPAKLDKRCAATFAIAGALHSLDYVEPDPYLRGIRHVQKEGSFGPPVDEAAKLRAQCALGLVRSRYPDALVIVAELLADPESHARIGAVRALASNGGEGGVMLLRYKALIGDKDSEVVTECLSALLSADFSRSLPFVARFMDAEDEEFAESAVLAIAAQRRAEAFAVLRAKWDRSVYSELRDKLLAAFATMRLEEASNFLVELVESASTPTAVTIVKVLAAYHRDEVVRKKLRAIVEAGASPEVRSAFRESW
jgi:hypothetical protein